MNDRVIFLKEFKTIPWQIIEKLQICYDNGDDIIKGAALDAAKQINRHLSVMESIWIDRVHDAKPTD